jgi:hypothetical protein
MNMTNDRFPLNVLGGFAPSGFFKKAPVGASQSAPRMMRKHNEAATSAQAARLNGLLSHGTPSPLKSSRDFS